MRTYFVHGSHCMSVLLLALATDTLAQTSSSQAPGLVRLCTSSNIANMDVANCNCPSDFPSPQTALTCKTNPQTCTQSCHPPTGGSVTSRAQLNTCGAGCVDANNDCNGCYVWFHSLCGCLQRLQQQQTTNCIPSSNITPGQKTPPVFMVNEAHDLITTTYLIPGILQLHEIPNYWVGFELGQNTLRNTPGIGSTGALALNPVASRSEEQIHIHLCNNKNSKVRDALDGLNRASYTALAPVDVSKVDKRFAMECRVASAPNTNIDQGGDILKYLQNLDAKEGPGNCDQYQVGSGYMVDTKGYAWSCITTTRSAEEIFCHN